MRTEDGYIINQCLNGSPEAFGLLVDKYKESVYALAYSKLRNFHDAEDITQEAFIKAFQKLRTLKRGDSFLAWIFSITANLCKDLLRSSSVRPDGEYAEDQEEDILERPSMDAYHEEQRYALLHDALAELPEMYRQVLTLYYLADMSTKEIARFLGTPHDTVRQRLSRARTQLKEEMLTMMTATFETHRLQPGFTFHIVEMIKHTKIEPVPRATPLSLGLSVTAGLIAVLLSFTFPYSPLYPIGELIGSALPSKTQVAEKGVIPVEKVDITKITILTSESGKKNFGQKHKPKIQMNAPMIQEGRWTRKKAEMPTPRVGFGFGEVNGKIYTIGGRIIIGFRGEVAIVEMYDPERDRWTKRADMPTPLSLFATAVVNGKIYVMGGTPDGGINNLSSVYMYDPTTDVWTKKADMPTARSHFSAREIDGKIYAIGGWNRGPVLSTVEMYNPVTNTWTKRADMPTARYLFSTCVVDGKIYVIGGGENVGTLATAEEYDPVTDIWTKKADMPTPRWGLSTSVVNKKIYAMGGETIPNSGIMLSTVEVYDPATDIWTQEADMPVPKAFWGLSFPVIEGKIYVIGGAGKEIFSTVDVFDPGLPHSVNAEGKLATLWGKLKAR